MAWQVSGQVTVYQSIATLVNYQTKWVLLPTVDYSAFSVAGSYSLSGVHGVWVVYKPLCMHCLTWQAATCQ